MGRALPLSLSWLLLLLLLLHTCIPASWGLQCVQCERNGPCQVEECTDAQDLCRTTIMKIWKDGDEHEVEERGCTHSDKTNKTLSYRTGRQIITLTEVVCGSNLCNQRRPDPPIFFPRTRYLECSSCASSDLSCERGRDQSLQCRSPEEKCVDMVTHWDLEVHPRDEQHIRGCGDLSGCPGPTGFHNNHTFHFLRCCNTTNCNGGPVTELQNLPPNEIQCYSCEGNSSDGCSREQASLITCRGPMDHCLEASGTHELGTPNYTVRGCATSSWCQGSHVAEVFSLTHVNVSCCTGNACNNLAWDIEPRTGGTPRFTSCHLSLAVTLLVIVFLWGDTPLRT